MFYYTKKRVMKSTNNIFFFYMYMYVDDVVHFVMGLLTMIHQKKYICL
jgi:hypothetical protein